MARASDACDIIKSVYYRHKVKGQVAAIAQCVFASHTHAALGSKCHWFSVHVLLLAGHESGRCFHWIFETLNSVSMAAHFPAILEPSLLVTPIDHRLPSHQRSIPVSLDVLAIHQPQLGGFPLCHLLSIMQHRLWLLAPVL